MRDNKDGTYYVSYTPKEPGVYTVVVCIKEQHVQVSGTYAWPWPPFSLLPLASTISGCGDMTWGIGCVEGLHGILFLPSLHLRNDADFAGDHKNPVPIPPPGCWACILSFFPLENSFFGKDTFIPGGILPRDKHTHSSDIL